MPCVQGHVSAGVFRFYLYNQNFLPIKKFTLRTCKKYDENHCVYLARTGRHNEKAGGNMTMQAQHRIIFA